VSGIDSSKLKEFEQILAWDKEEKTKKPDAKKVPVPASVKVKQEEQKPATHESHKVFKPKEMTNTVI